MTPAKSSKSLLVAGNWKMNGSKALIEEFGRAFSGWNPPASVSLLLFPPAPYLADMAQVMADFSWLQIGGQDVHPQSAGAYTGDLAGVMIAEMGGLWALVGHSERREYHQETDSQVAQKYIAALQAGLRPILCVGETLAQRDGGEAEQVVAAQVESVLVTLAEQGPSAKSDLVIAYEPVWAIGTGRTATPEQAQQMHAHIRQLLTKAQAAMGGRILYGGSVKPDNAAALFSQADIDGALIGGASLDAAGFIEIAESC